MLRGCTVRCFHPCWPMGRGEEARRSAETRAIFSFLYLKKIKISKIYVRFEIFQNYPRSPYGGTTDPKCNFFSSNLQRGSWQKKCKGACRPPEGRLPPTLKALSSGSRMQLSGPSRGWVFARFEFQVWEIVPILN